MEIKLFLIESNYQKLKSIVYKTDYCAVSIVNSDGGFVDCILTTKKVDLIIIELLKHIK